MLLPRTLSRKVVLPAYFTASRVPFYRELDLLRQSQWWPRERLWDLAQSRLASIITAAAALPFYRTRFSACGLDPASWRSAADLAGIPLLIKSDLPDLLAGVGGHGYLRKTAGTSGRPIAVLASPRAQAASLAARYRCYDWYGVLPGDREARFWGRPLQPTSISSSLRRLALNRTVFDSRHVQPEAAAETRRRIVAGAFDYAYGYSSLIMRLARAMEVGGLPSIPGLKLIVTTAEASTQSERDWLAGTLGGHVADEYGCSEIDIIAFTCPAGNRHIMAENVLVEALPVVGHSGLSQIVVTDLNNDLMPMIRYCIEDLVRLSDAACPCGRTLPVLESVQGRSRRQFIKTPDGRSVHVVSFPYFMEERQSAGIPIRQFRVVQLDLATLDVEVVVDLEDESGFAELCRQIDGLVREQFGPEMKCRVRRVDEIVAPPGVKYEYFSSMIDGGEPT
ncbi:MAG: phenylacetate--CoA ligase family protein [bacterium]|nr:phenylacetate--CoA ligase family protein [bacterium]